MSSNASLPRLSIIVPVFNEEHTLVKILHQVLAQPLHGWAKEIIVVDDGSTDGSLQKITPFLNSLKLIRHQRNLGRGMAIRSALARATGDAVIFQDADLEYDPADWPGLLTQLNNPRVLVVYGSRTIHPKNSGYPLYVIGSRLLTRLTNLFLGSRLTDLYTCYKLFRRSVVEGTSFTTSGFEFEIELTTYFLSHGIHIIEVPITYHPRTFAAGKKITPLDGLKGLVFLISLSLKGCFRRLQK